MTTAEPACVVGLGGSLHSLSAFRLYYFIASLKTTRRFWENCYTQTCYLFNGIRSLSPLRHGSRSLGPIWFWWPLRTRSIWSEVSARARLTVVVWKYDAELFFAPVSSLFCFLFSVYYVTDVSSDISRSITSVNENIMIIHSERIVCSHIDEVIFIRRGTFLSRVSILLPTRDIDIVILSVCPWHAGIVWKRLNVSS